MAVKFTLSSSNLRQRVIWLPGNYAVSQHTDLPYSSEILGFYSGVDKDSSLFGCEAVFIRK